MRYPSILLVTLGFLLPSTLGSAAVLGAENGLGPEELPLGGGLGAGVEAAAAGGGLGAGVEAGAAGAELDEPSLKLYLLGWEI